MKKDIKVVSVIIPNYNYARFLKRRIDSIVQQTVKPAKIIFLDDCSSDDSLIIAEKLLSEANIEYQIISNEINQGVFKQWLTGIELTESEYFWIAEADDYCELNFLETLLPAFNDENVVMAHAESKVVNLDDDIVGYSTDGKSAAYQEHSYWFKNYISDQNYEITKYLSLDCSIYNVSSVIFNKSLLDIKQLQITREYKKCGDWLFYIISLSSFEKNKFYHSKELLNYHVVHSQSVYGSSKRDVSFAKETLLIFKYLLDNFQIEHTRINEIIIKMVNIMLWNDVDLDVQQIIFSIVYNHNFDFLNQFKKSFIEKHEAINWLEAQAMESIKTIATYQEQITILENNIANQNIELTSKQGQIRLFEKQNNSYIVEIETITNSFYWKALHFFGLVNRNQEALMGRLITNNTSGIPYKVCAKLITISGLFDSEYYLVHNPDVAKSNIEPLKHFIKFGWKEGRNPSYHFNTSEYLLVNQDVKDARINPLLHYILYGAYEGRLAFMKRDSN